MAMADATSTQWLATLQQAQDALSKELLCVERRYHGRVVEKQADGSVRMQCFISLSDPDLPSELKGESELMLTFPANYPTDAVQIDLKSWRHRMSADQLAAITAAVATRAKELRGTYSIRKLLTWLDNNVHRLLQEAAPPAPELTQHGAIVEHEQPKPDDGDAANDSTKATTKPRQCRFFVRGECKSGQQCKFAHTLKEETNKTATKKKKKKTPKTPASGEGDDQRAATTDAPPPADTKPIQPSAATNASNQKKEKDKKEPRKRPCKFDAKGACRAGEQCKFSHQDKPQSQGDAPPQTKKTGIIITVIGQPLPPQEEPVEPEPPASPEPPAPADWTAEQQRQLDAALKKYPTTMDKKERWTGIASEVDGKTLNDCIDRFKLISELVKTGGVIPIAPPRVAPPTSPPSSPVSQVPHTTEDHPAEEEADAPATAKIIPDDQRVAIETEPEVNGASLLRLEDLFLYQIGTVVLHSVVCQVQCTQCPLKFDAKLTLANASLQQWCPRCSAKHYVALRPAFTHAHSNVLAYIDSDNCGVIDVLPSDLLVTCLECGKEALFQGVVSGRRAEQACFSCHTKLALMTKRYAISGASTEAASAAAANPATQGKNKYRRPTENLVLGQPLPRKGVCDHYTNSFRWFRFQCCGKAFPCDVCHDSSDCSEANTGKFASKTICGFCSKEQASTVKACSCGNTLGRAVNRSRHWEGGQGCRDQTRMSTQDKHKFRGKSKTESQKAKRVGLIGKLRTMRAAERTAAD